MRWQLDRLDDSTLPMISFLRSSIDTHRLIPFLSFFPYHEVHIAWFGLDIGRGG
jgi:hypothetical protein